MSPCPRTAPKAPLWAQALALLLPVLVCSDSDGMKRINLSGVPVMYNESKAEPAKTAKTSTKTWLLKVPRYWTDEQMQLLVADLPPGASARSVGHPSSGGLPFLTVSATLAQLEALIQKHPGELEYAEEDLPVAAIPEKNLTKGKTLKPAPGRRLAIATVCADTQGTATGVEDDSGQPLTCAGVAAAQLCEDAAKGDQAKAGCPLTCGTCFPTLVRLTGSCWSSQNGHYESIGNAASGLPVYKQMSGSYYIYYDPACDGGSGDPRWVLSDSEPSMTAESDLESDQACIASAYWKYDAAAAANHAGMLGPWDAADAAYKGTWRAYCSSGWTDSDRVLYAVTPSDGSDGRQIGPKSWGLDRIDQVGLPLDDTYNYGTSMGAGAHVYVLDTGVRTTHTDFGGRAIPTLEALPEITVCDPSDTNCASDHDGHGTHCAGTVAGTEFGVAKEATIHAVKVLGDGASWSGIIAAMDWILVNGERPAVLSMSLGCVGRCPETLSSSRDAVKATTDGGISVVVAAGNEADDACHYGFSYAPEAISVGSTDKTDTVSSFSNYGSCVDVFGPGSSIMSAGDDADDSVDEMSGTSMATPSVAGAIARLLGKNSELTPAEIKHKITWGCAQRDVLNGLDPVSPNLLLHTTAATCDDSSSSTATTTQNPWPCEAANAWEVASGLCQLDVASCCITSPGFPNDYATSQSCDINVGSHPGMITLEKFDTERTYDKLTVNGVPYHGLVGPDGVVPQGTIEWSSDSSTTRAGWKMCLSSRADPDFTATSTTATSTKLTTTVTTTSTWKYCEDISDHCITLSGSDTTCENMKGFCDHDQYGEWVRATCAMTCNACDTACQDVSMTCISLSGQDATCPDLAGFCDDAGLGPKIRALCPQTCNVCQPTTTETKTTTKKTESTTSAPTLTTTSAPTASLTTTTRPTLTTTSAAATSTASNKITSMPRVVTATTSRAAAGGGHGGPEGQSCANVPTELLKKIEMRTGLVAMKATKCAAKSEVPFP